MSWIWTISTYKVMINFLTVIVEWLIKTHMYPYSIRTINKKIVDIAGAGGETRTPNIQIRSLSEWVNWDKQ